MVVDNTRDGLRRDARFSGDLLDSDPFLEAHTWLRLDRSDLEIGQALEAKGILGELAPHFVVAAIKLRDSKPTNSPAG